MATAELHEVMSNMETDSRSPISGDLELRWQLAEQTEVAKVTLQHHLTGVGFAELPTLEEMLGDRPVNLATGDAKEIYQDLVGQSYEVMAWILSFESDDEKDDSENDTDDESGDEGGDEDGDDSDDNEDGDTEHYEAMENVT
ncbi:hypothetical protein P154DRAFT_524152 [Amniculicola lignicola CBS 123094]|uniref:Uncharacterized protein n=1 Tax=Amniculicola lignicola CBS 123094 TaxID=1392246 RepID=A0A6A5WAN2_9PLEO|nr:hypothetical protein P154DRAFT_524152 [Amniculicola lignicola CBS 123094]